MTKALVKTQYLLVMGSLYPDNRFQLRPCYQDDIPSNSKEDLEGSIVVQLYDEDEKLLLRYHLSTKPFSHDTVNKTYAVFGKIPFPLATRIIRFYRDEILLHEITVSKNKPEISFRWKHASIVKGKHVIAWEGYHPEKLPLEYFVKYSHTNGNNWEILSFPTTDTRMKIDFNNLPGGKKCKIAVVCPDGVNTVVRETKPFSVAVKPCISLILNPKDGSTFTSAEQVILRGYGFYLEEGRQETEDLTWTSSKDGKLGKGTILRPLLSRGSHKITLKAGRGIRLTEKTISIKVG